MTQLDLALELARQLMTIASLAMAVYRSFQSDTQGQTLWMVFAVFFSL